ncbi:hypothetical protein HZB94_02850 [Candidatus Falkowbacteria bacterium]|nr:hypothetical protein [Candidatus Falkowbacteria bacterium]
MNKFLKLEKIWLATIIIIIIAISVSLAFRFPHPFNYEEYAPDYHWFDLTLRSTFLRLNDLSNLAAPLASAPVNGYDYIYTSVSNLFQFFYLAPLKCISWFLNLNNTFVFLVCSKLLMILINCLAFYSLYRLLILIFPEKKSSARVICLLFFLSWPIFSYLEVSRWMPLLILLFCVSLYHASKLLAGFQIFNLIMAAVALFLLSAIHFFGIVFALAVSFILLISRWQRKKVVALLLLLAIVGGFLQMAQVYYYSKEYDKLRTTETGFSHIIRYTKTWFKTWQIITLASLGKTQFHLNLHGLVPNMLSDLTTSVVPPLPENFVKAREALGLKWTRWSTLHGDNNWYRYQLAAVGFITQVALLLLLSFVFVGLNVFSRKSWSAFRFAKIRQWYREQTEAKRFVLKLLAIYFLMYLFVFFRIECEPYARYGLMAPFFAIIGMFIADNHLISDRRKISVLIYLTIFALLSVSFQVNREIITPARRPEYGAYRNLIEWSQQNAKNRALYFDFSDYYYLPAKVIIDGPMPLREYAFPNLKNHWDYDETYGSANTMIIGISADMPSEKASELANLFSIGKVVSLNEIPSREIGVYYMPRRPKDGQIMIEYFEKVLIPMKNRFVYFYAGKISSAGSKSIK